MENLVKNMAYHDISYLMNASFENIIMDFNMTLEHFIIFNEGDEVIEIPKHKGMRSKSIDRLIDYFITTEEYEKCNELKKLKKYIIENGN